MTLLALSLAWLAGVAAAARYGWDAWPLVPAAAVGGALLVARRPRSAAALPAVLLPLLLLAGLWRYQASLPSPASDDVARFNHGPPVSFRGVVEDEPELRDTSQRFRLRVQAIREGEAWRPASGAVLVTAGLFPRYRYGDLLELHGELQTPPRFSRFDYRDYLARRGVRALAAYPSIRVLDRGRGNPLREPLAAAREALGRSLARALPEPEASLARGIVLGQRSALPPWLEADLARTGTSHIVAVSGFNVTLVAGLTLGLLAPAVGRRRAVLAALLAVAAYTLLTGATPSVVRAAVMAALVLLAALAGRQSSAPVALAFAAALMTAADPGLIRDVGFQLSVAATAGLVLLAPPLAGLLWRLLGREEPAARTGLLRAPVEVAATTAAAYLATAPIAAVTFGSLSLVALAANLLVVPAFSAAFVLACLAALAGLAGLDAALLPGLAAWAPLHYTVEAVHRLARLPGAAVGLPPLSLSHAAALYTAAGLVWLTLRRGRAADRLAALAAHVRRLLPPARLLGPAAAAALLVPAAWAAWGLLDRPEPALRVTFLDVGQGDAVLVRTPDGGTVLV
ncbi:MAG TPA: ComEC/Rec2 family competence protein, partial [Dehalococcoidia bacterium]